MMGVLVDLYASPRLLPLAVLRGYAFSRLHNTAGSSRKYPRCCLSIAAANYESFTTRAPRLSVESMLLNLLRRHLFMGLTASALSSSAPAAKGAIRYRQLWVSADGVTHIDEQECGKLETKDFTSTGGDAALQYVRAFSNSDDFALTGLVVTQQVGENPWHFCPSPQFVVTLEGSWYIRTSDGKTTTFKPGDVLYQDNSAEHPLAKLGASGQAPSGAQHWSGANGGPCNQLVLGVKPRVFPAPKPGAW